MIGEIIENLPMLLLPGYIIFLIIYFIKIILKKEFDFISLLKFIVCLQLTKWIIVGIFVMMVMHVYQLALIFDEVGNVEPIVRSTGFAVVEFVWSLIGILLSWSIFKMIYFRKILPGKGNIKQRFVNLVKG